MIRCVCHSTIWRDTLPTSGRCRTFLVIALSFLIDTSSPTTTTGVALHSWFVGHWSTCSAPCGTAETKEREVYCHQTCSVYRCTQVASSLCIALHGNPPASIQNCGTFAPPCPSSTTATTVESTTSTLRTTTTTSTVRSVSDTTKAGSTIDCREWTCRGILGQGCAPEVAGTCGTNCPCWVRSTSPPSPSPPSPPSPTSPPSPSPSPPTPGAAQENEGLPTIWLVVMIIAIAIAAAILVGAVYALCKARQRSKLLAKTGSRIVRSPFEKTNEGTAEAWKDDRDTKSRERPHAWRDPFERPPDPKVDFSDIPRKPNRNQDSDDSTADSSHCDDDNPLLNRPTTQARTSTTEEDVSDDDASRGSGARLPKKGSSHATPSRQRNQKTAAEKAFGNLREHEREKTRSTSRSPHPKGTAVPPRKNDAESNASSSPSAEKMGKSQSTPTPPPSTPPANSGNQQEPSPDKSTSVGATADDGVAIVVGDHIARLDAELDANRKKDLEFRRQHFKELCLKWHPDKNTGGMGEAESSAQANEIFKHLLSRRGGYLS